MTGPEVTAAMKAEDVDAALVTRAAEAMEDAAFRLIGRDLGTIYRDQIAREALAAVLPEIQAQALREAADELDLPGSTATGYYASEAVGGYNDAERDIEAWLTKRATRLTATTEGTTT